MAASAFRERHRVGEAPHVDRRGPIVVALERFVTLLDGPLYFSGVLLIAFWAYWIVRHERHWNTSDCGDDADDEGHTHELDCIDKFMEWVSPFVAGFAASGWYWRQLYTQHPSLPLEPDQARLGG